MSLALAGSRPSDGAQSTQSGPVERRDGGTTSVVHLNNIAKRFAYARSKEGRAGTHDCMGQEEADRGPERVKDKRVGAHDVEAVPGVV